MTAMPPPAAEARDAPEGGGHLHLKYRPDIDGLRTIAVLSVVAFHMGFSALRGGFVGVDIFFVISGYLIGKSIYDDVRADRFSIIAFYERRFRRILPALFVMLAVVSVAATGLLYPVPLLDYGRTLLAAALSYSNIHFWQTTGYFAGPAEAKPLLHTWSLGVEEQYYILFPLLMWLVWRYARRHLVAIIIAISAISFLWSAIGAFRAPTATFFLLPTRAWELLLGFLVSLPRVPILERERPRAIAAWVGLALIAGSIVVLYSRLPFPGIAALPPCLGAALLILAGSHGPSRVTGWLAAPPMVFIGLLSYSLYLWHWPVLVFAKHALLLPEDDPAVRVALFGLMLGLAWLSWRFVERPFRVRGLISRRAIFAGAGAGALAFALVMAMLVRSDGMPGRFAAPVARMAGWLGYSADKDYRAGTCFLTSEDRFDRFRPDICLKFAPDRPNVLLVGDSHAAHLYWGLARAYPGINLLQANASGCKPMLPAARGDLPRCSEVRHYALETFLPRHRIDYVILSARWNEQDLAPLARMLDWARERGIRVILAGPVPEYVEPLPQLIADGIRRVDPRYPAGHMMKDRARIDGELARLVAGHGATYVSPYRALCGGGPCRTLAPDGSPVQFDYGHLSPQGSLLVAHAFANALGQRPAL